MLFLFSVVIFKTGIDKIDNLTQFTIGSSKAAKLQAPSSTLQGQLSSEVTESLDIRKMVWKGAVDLGLRYPLLVLGQRPSVLVTTSQTGQAQSNLVGLCI